MKRTLLLLVALLHTNLVHAQIAPPQYVGIPSGQFNFVAAAQVQDEWCWAASVQMILNWYRIPVSQAMVVQRTKGVLIDQGGSDADISSALSGWGVTTNGRAVTIQSFVAQGPPAPAMVVNQLSMQHPILLTFATGAYSGHAVVITAASYYPTPYGPQIQSLIIRDPWPSPQNVQNAGRVEIGGQDLVNFLPLIRNHWLVSVM